MALLAIATAGVPGAASGQGTAVELPLPARGGGGVSAAQAARPGLAASVDALDPSVLAQGSPAGNTPSAPRPPLAGRLTLSDAVQRGLAYNLTAVGLVNATRQANAQTSLARSLLMPNIIGWLSDSEQKVNLTALGLRQEQPFPGFTIPETAGPFNLFDLRARVSQTVFDRTALNNYRAAQETARGTGLGARDARDLIVLAVGGAYLQTVATSARLQSASAQLATAKTLHDRAAAQRSAGLATPLDVNRAHVQVLAQRQRLSALQADVATQKIELARMIGLPPTDQYELETNLPFAPAAATSLADAVSQAVRQRADVKAAEAHVRAAELALVAAESQRLPTLAVSADYGTSRASPASAKGTYSIAAAVRIPIWEGGRAQGGIEQAQAVLAQRRAELDDVRAETEADVRKAWLSLQAAVSQVDVARLNLGVGTETLALTRQRFDAGVGDNLAVVQAQEAMAAAELDVINSVFAHNMSKLRLARAVGRAADGLSDFVSVP